MRTGILRAAPCLGALLVLAFSIPLARAQDAIAAGGSSARSQQQGATAGSPGTSIEFPKRQSLLDQTLGDAKAYYTAPLRWNRRDWAYFGGALAAIAVAHHYDTQVRTHFDQGSKLPYGPKASGELTDALPGFAAVAATWGYAELIGSHAGKGEAWNMLESAGLSFVTAYGLKYAIGRERPDATTGPNHWFSGGTSFPSEHVTAAFAIGTVLAESGNPQYRWIRRVLGYGIGFGTAYLRMKHNAHWLSDTVAGAALGIATAHFVLDRSNQREAALSEFSLVPIRGGLMLAFSMQLSE